MQIPGLPPGATLWRAFGTRGLDVFGHTGSRVYVDKYPHTMVFRPISVIWTAKSVFSAFAFKNFCADLQHKMDEFMIILALMGFCLGLRRERQAFAR